jgi:hypothetical protein
MTSERMQYLVQRLPTGSPACTTSCQYISVRPARGATAYSTDSGVAILAPVCRSCVVASPCSARRIWVAPPSGQSFK